LKVPVWAEEAYSLTKSGYNHKSHIEGIESFYRINIFVNQIDISRPYLKGETTVICGDGAFN